MDKKSLTFFWKDNDKRILILFCTLPLAFLIHFLGLYIFKIKTPKIKRSAPNNKKISLISNKINSLNKNKFKEINFLSEPYISNDFDENDDKDYLRDNIDFNSRLNKTVPSLLTFQDIQNPTSEGSISSILNQLVSDSLLPKFTINKDNYYINNVKKPTNMNDDSFNINDIIMKDRTVNKFPTFDIHLLKFARDNGLIFNIAINNNGDILLCMLENDIVNSKINILNKTIVTQLKFNNIDSSLTDFSTIVSEPMNRENLQWGQISF